MKLLIAVDMEGISGVVDWKHVDSTHAEYQRFRHIMTADVNAAVAGAAEAGVEDILVADGHGYARNILIEELDPRARLNSGSPSPFSMVQGIDSGVQAAMFIGYHAQMGTRRAVLAHTWSSACVSNVWLNGCPTGEIGLNASVCGFFEAPVLLISGDQAACDEACQWMPEIETVPVKKASGRQAAECLPPAVSQALIRQASQRACLRYLGGSAPAPLHTDSPVKVGVEFIHALHADRAELLPGAIRLDSRTLEFVSEDMPCAYRAFRAMVALADG